MLNDRFSASLKQILHRLQAQCGRRRLSHCAALYCHSCKLCSVCNFIPLIVLSWSFWNQILNLPVRPRHQMTHPHLTETVNHWQAGHSPNSHPHFHLRQRWLVQWLIGQCLWRWHHGKKLWLERSIIINYWHAAHRATTNPKDIMVSSVLFLR